jgi:hypothetical protein
MPSPCPCSRAAEFRRYLRWCSWQSDFTWQKVGKFQKRVENYESTSVDRSKIFISFNRWNSLHSCFAIVSISSVYSVLYPTSRALKWTATDELHTFRRFEVVKSPILTNSTYFGQSETCTVNGLTTCRVDAWKHQAFKWTFENAFDEVITSY